MTEKSYVVTCGCGKVSDEHGYFPDELFNTVDITIEGITGNVWNDGVSIEGTTQTVSYEICYGCWKKVRAHLEGTLGFRPNIKRWEG